MSNPNQHAEMHGLASYDNLCGATEVLSAAGFIVGAINSAIATKIGKETPGSLYHSGSSLLVGEHLLKNARDLTGASLRQAPEMLGKT